MISRKTTPIGIPISMPRWLGDCFDVGAMVGEEDGEKEKEDEGDKLGIIPLTLLVGPPVSVDLAAADVVAVIVGR